MSLHAPLAHTAHPEPFRDLEAIPLLGLLTCIAALVDLSLNGIAMRTLGDAMPHGQMLTLAKWGDLPRNLTAIAGLIALPAALVAYLKTRRWANVQRRLVIAGFAGIFLPIVALATLVSPEVLPHDDRTIKLVKVGIGAANVLAVLIGLVAFRRGAPIGIRIAVLLATAACFFAFAALAVAEIRWIALSRYGVTAFHMLRRLGESAYLAVPLAAAATMLPLKPDARGRIAIGVGAAVAVAVAAFLGWGLFDLKAEFDIVLYGAQRLELFSGGWAFVYVLPLSIGFGVGALGLASASPTQRQAGVALLLLLAAGFAPRSPGPLLTMVLGIALLSRASIAFGEQRLASRATAERERVRIDEPIDEPPPSPEPEPPAEDEGPDEPDEPDEPAAAEPDEPGEEPDEPEEEPPSG